MAVPLTHRIADRLPEAASLYHRLLLVVGRTSTGKTAALRDLAEERAWPLVNVNLELSERLLELTSKQRSLRVPRLLAEIADAHPGEVLLLDNTEVLFSTELQQDPLRLLQGLGRIRTVVATWSGDIDEENLTYAAPGHPECRRYSRSQLLIVPTVDVRPATEHAQTGPQNTVKEKVA
jgi:hypothetical protein